MRRLFAQGDILIERLDEAPVSGHTIASVVDGTVVVAAGEATGHHHRLRGTVVLFRDDARARDVPEALYIGHVNVIGSGSRLDHEEHAPVILQAGTYRIRRQRYLEPTDSGLLANSSLVED